MNPSTLDNITPSVFVRKPLLLVTLRLPFHSSLLKAHTGHGPMSPLICMDKTLLLKIVFTAVNGTVISIYNPEYSFTIGRLSSLVYPLYHYSTHLGFHTFSRLYSHTFSMSHILATDQTIIPLFVDSISHLWLPAHSFLQ